MKKSNAYIFTFYDGECVFVVNTEPKLSSTQLITIETLFTKRTSAFFYYGVKQGRIRCIILIRASQKINQDFPDE